MYLVYMKTLLLLLFLASVSCVHAYDVVDGARGGYVITATKALTIATPSGEVVQLSPEPFISNDWEMPPTAPIVCSWDPTGTWVAVFMQQARMDSVFVFNLKTNTALVQNDGPDVVFPEWYNAHGVVYSTVDTPGTWNGNSLTVNTRVLWRDASVPAREMPQVLTVAEDGSFSLRPVVEPAK